MFKEKLEEVAQQHGYACEVVDETIVKIELLHRINYNYYISYTKLNGQMYVKMEVDEKQQKRDVHKLLPEALYELIMERLVWEAKKETLIAIHFQSKEIREELLQRKGFRESHNEQYRYTCVIDEEKERFIQEIEEEVERQLREIYAKDCTFQARKKGKLGINHIISGSLALWDYYWEYYFEGYDGKLRLYMREGSYYLQEVIKKEDYLITKKEDVTTALSQVIQNVLNRTRVRNLTEPPVRHFNHIFRNDTKEAKEAIRRMILKCCSNKEIETIAARQESVIWQEFEGFQCTVFGPYYLMRKKEGISWTIWLYKTKARMEKEIKKCLMDEMNQKAEKFFESLK